jgi:hypothetical protein
MTITHIYTGRREKVLAETACPDFYAGKYLIYPIGDSGSYAAEGCASKKELNVILTSYRASCPEAQIVKV